MKKETFIKNFLDVYQYLYMRSMEDIEIDNHYGLRIGILRWPSITGEAQKLINLAVKDELSKDPIFETIKKSFLDVDPSKGTKWVLSSVVSRAGTLTAEYAEIFTRLVKLTKKEQENLLNKYENIVKANEVLIGLTDLKHKVMLYCRILNGDITKDEIYHLAHLKCNNNIETLEQFLIGEDSSLALVLERGIKYMPGREANVEAKFPWLFEEVENVG